MSYSEAHWFVAVWCILHSKVCNSRSCTEEPCYKHYTARLSGWATHSLYISKHCYWHMLAGMAHKQSYLWADKVQCKQGVWFLILVSLCIILDAEFAERQHTTQGNDPCTEAQFNDPCTEAQFLTTPAVTLLTLWHVCLQERHLRQTECPWWDGRMAQQIWESCRFLV